MFEQLLYDKVISVTLFRQAKKTPSRYAVANKDSYMESTVHGRKVIRNAVSEKSGLVYSVLKTDKQGNPTDIQWEGSTYKQVGLIEFYEGDYREVFDGYKNSNTPGVYVERYKRIYARGHRYTLQTRDDMKLGIRPDGSPFETGDKIRIVEDGSTWNVYKEGSTSSAYEERVIELPAQVLELKCTEQGLKPDISLKINLLPAQNCYGATLRIKNFSLDPLNIRYWDRMVIVAGYRTGKKAVFNCPIYSSYLESPNPDGVLVFEGLTVGQAEDVLNDRYLTISFKQEQISLETLIRDVAAGISSNIEVKIALDDELKQATVVVSKQKVYAQNGTAVLNWLQSFVSNFVEQYTDGITTTFMQLVGDKLEVIAINGRNEIPVNWENIVNLDMVTGATFSGTALTVEAPWNPDLRPGDLFFMPPQFINGLRLPNSIPVDSYRNASNLYRALTISLEFASTDTINKMVIVAVPAQYAGELPDKKITEMPADIYGQLLTEKYKKEDKEIPVGGEDAEEVEKLRDAQQNEKTGNDFIDEGDNIITQWGKNAWTTITQSSYTGSCISMIASYYLYEMIGGPSLTEGQGNKRQRRYNEPKSWLKDQHRQKAIDHYQNTGCSAQYLWWPLITLGTYWRREMDIEQGVDNNWTKIYPENPNFIDIGKSVYVPVFPDGNWEDNRARLASIKDIWKYAYLTYKDLYEDSSKVWRAMYYYLGGIDELD